MIGLRFKTKGVPELIKALREADKKIAKRAMNKSVREATKPILKDAKAGVAVDTKTLKKALGTKVKVYKGGAGAVGLVGIRKDKKGKPVKHKRKVGTNSKGEDVYRDPVKYAHMVEFGTKPHTVAKGDMLARKGRKHRERQIGKKHPGAKPQPFLRPALDKNKGQVKATMVRVLKTALDEVRKK
jgi:HK97 gp10 family phage protein